MKKILVSATLACGLALTYSIAKKEAEDKPPVEVGLVNWGRDLDAALAEAKEGKPALVLFQEIPGCAGCRKFGSEVLTHPLLVEAIENEFTPVLVYNNRSTGKDVENLKRFGEPAWNYQVIRFLDSEGKDVIPRKDKIWTVEAVASRMVEALEAADRDVPNYLRGLAPKKATETVAFSMHCFWTGEYELGKIDGVVSTEAGWFDGREVTLVDYVPEKIDLVTLSDKAAAVKCANKIYPKTKAQLAEIRAGKGNRLQVGELTNEYKPAKKSDQKKQIGSLNIDSIPALTEFQKMKLNSHLRAEPEKAKSWLSPKQRTALEKILAKK